MKQKIVLIVSVVVGLLAAILTRSYLSAKENEYNRMKEDLRQRNAKTYVIAAKADLPSGTILKSSDLCAVQVPSSMVKGNYVKEDNHLALVGRKTLFPLQKESPILWSSIDGGGPDARGLAGDIKSRMRAIAVNVSGAASVGGMVTPNDHVDVLGTFSFPSKSVPGEMELITMTILQDVLVLATGRETAKSRLFGERVLSSGYNTVTLEVTPREAEILVFCEQIKGRLSLALRNSEDVYFEATLPSVDFKRIQGELESLNEYRQKNILRKR